MGMIAVILIQDVEQTVKATQSIALPPCGFPDFDITRLTDVTQVDECLKPPLSLSIEP